jgi:hypothetical protein
MQDAGREGGSNGNPWGLRKSVSPILHRIKYFVFCLFLFHGAPKSGSELVGTGWRVGEEVGGSD